MVGTIVNLVRTVGDPNHTSANVNLALLYVAATAVAITLTVVYARSGTLKERQARELGLRFQVARVNAVDPMRVGVGVPAPAQRKAADKYLSRGRDGELDRAVRTALSPRARQWFVMIVGRSTVGKSRTLFEALRRFDANSQQDRLQLVAPKNASALRDMFDPSKGSLKVKGPAVLWLDDVEGFLRDGMAVDDLLRWRSSGPRRMVAATLGGAAFTAGGDVLQYLDDSTRQIPLEKTRDIEIRSVHTQLSKEEFDAARRHGWAAYLVAGHLLEKKLITAKHPGDAPGSECDEGIAVVQAVVDWTRCGRSDPIGRDTLAQLWRDYLPQTLHPTDDGFAAGLDWALKKVAGTIALVEYASINGGDAYVAYPYTVVICSERDSEGPRDQGWAAAVKSAPPVQAMSVGVTAYAVSRWRDAVEGLTQAVEAPVGAVPAEHVLVGLQLLYDIHSKLGQREEAIGACEAIIDRVGGDPDPVLRAIGGDALLNKGCQLHLGWPDQEEKRDEVLAVWDQLINGYFCERDPALRRPAAGALVNKVEVLAGSVYFFREDKREEALTAWNRLIDDYYSNPDPNPAPILRQWVATALGRKAYVLSEHGPLGEGDEDNEREALAAHQQLVNTFGADPDPTVQDLVKDAVANIAMLLIRKRDRSEAAFVVVLAALQNTEQKLVSLAISGARGSAVDEQTAQLLLNKASMLSFLGGDTVEVRRCNERIINNYGGSNEPSMRRVVATAINNEGNICAKLDHLVDDARARYTRVITDYGGDSDPVLRMLVAKSRTALEELNKRH
jgi:tetratricopeptide (TPR) repeat protein